MQDLLKMRILIKRNPNEFWKVCRGNDTKESYSIILDGNDRKEHELFFSKEKNTLNDINEMIVELAEILKVDYIIV